MINDILVNRHEYAKLRGIPYETAWRYFLDIEPVRIPSTSKKKGLQHFWLSEVDAAKENIKNGTLPCGMVTVGMMRELLNISESRSKYWPRLKSFPQHEGKVKMCGMMVRYWSLDKVKSWMSKNPEIAFGKCSIPKTKKPNIEQVTKKHFTTLDFFKTLHNAKREAA